MQCIRRIRNLNNPIKIKYRANLIFSFSRSNSVRESDWATGHSKAFYQLKDSTKMASAVNNLVSNVKLAPTLPGEEIVISGISGSFPDSNSIKELEENLFNKVDLISDDNRRWDGVYSEIPRRSGKLKSIDKFDASFFGVDHKLAHSLDPGCRILLEKTYECIIDAGFNPEEIQNTKTGVFVGSSFIESENMTFYKKLYENDHGAMGCTRGMMANRVSNWLNISGPSYAVDTACSSSLYALEHAVNAIREGLCDAAIVAGVNLCLHPSVTLQFARLGVLSKNGMCGSFDDTANGYVRSECVAAVYLQKLKDSRRAYVQVVHAKTNCDGYKTLGITYPSGQMQKQLLDQFYHEISIEPSSLEFVEAHGTGTRAGDPEELDAIDKAFCAGRDRSNPLLIGSVKSNLGHTESAAGIVSICKLLIAYNTGFIPPNLNYSTPRSGVLCLAEGRAKVVSEKTPWNRGLAGANCFGFGGANAHVLLKKIAQDKVNGGLPEDNLPRIVCISGRTEAAVARILDDLESKPVDVEQVRLWHAVHTKNIKGHKYRGYVLLGSTPENSVPIARHVQHVKNEPCKPVILTFSSLEIKWLEIAYHLMDISQFAATIDKCQRVLESKNFKITELISETNNNIADLTTLSIIGNTLVHIGLTDICTSLGITPDYMIGHGVGELICAYADGLWTAEETITAAFKLCVALEKALQDKKGYIVQYNYKQTKLLCTENVWVGYDSNCDWCIISGSTNDVDQVVTKLTSQGVQTEQLQTFNLAYLGLDHEIAEELKDILPPLRLHSSRWVSSQALPSDVKQNSIVINAMSERMAKLDILNNFNKINVINVNIDRSNLNGQISFYTSLGKLFEAGLNLDLANIYPQVKFPVSQGTPMVSHLIEWDHSENWFVARFDQAEEIKKSEKKMSFCLDAENDEFVAGHVIDGRIIYPATGYLVLAWETLAMMTGRWYTKVSVVFEDVYFQRATNVPKDGSLEFTVTIHKSTGDFEIVENKMPVVTGRIYEKPNVGKEFRVIPHSVQNETNRSDAKVLLSKDFYKELNLRGYQYKGLFRGVLSCNIEGTKSHLLWKNNWVAFLDTVLQVKIVGTDTRSLYVPTRIEQVLIDVDLHSDILGDSLSKSIACHHFPGPDVIRAGGAELRGIHVTAISRRPPLGIPVYEKNEFVPNFIDNEFPLAESLRTNLQLILDNAQTFKFKTIELVDEEYEKNNFKPCIEDIENILGDLPMVNAELHVFSEQPLKVSPSIAVSDKKISGETNVVLLIAANLLQRSSVLSECASTLKNKCYLLSRETAKPSPQANIDYDILTCHFTGIEYLVLLRKKKIYTNSKRTYIKVVMADQKYSWINKVKNALNDGESLVLYNENEPVNGLLGLVNCLRREPGGETVSGILVADQSAPPFDPNNPFYKEQLDKDLAVLVYKNGQWGTYRHLLLKNLENVNALHAYVNTATIGDLTSLCWWEGPYSNLNLENNSDEAVVHVYSSALNFRDVMTAMGRVTLDAVARGRLAQDCVQGIEVAGKTPNGTRVMAICEKGISTLVKVDSSFAFCIPDEWSFDEAATIPVAYGTVYMALVMIGKIRRGESILIHAGSGGVGQAAINVALHHGLEVFTTVGTPAKRQFLQTLFPQLKDSHIGNSRDTSFKEMIFRETGGRGVDLVLNSLADDKLKASVNCLAHRGRFIEIGKYDITVNTQLELCFMKKALSFHGVMLDYINDGNYRNLRKGLHQLMIEGIASGAVRPLTYCTFDKENIEEAYRYMAAGKHIGKVIIKIRDDGPDHRNAKPSSLIVSAIPRYSCHSNEVYVLVGGLGGFGLELADWLVLRGARKLLITSRKGVTNGYQSSRLRIWQSYGTEIKISTDDITDETGCKKILEAASMMGTVKAIFNLAVVLCDAVFENQTLDSFRTSFGPKATAAIHLDKLSRAICPELRDFVMFSSVSCGRGNAGQTNYGFSNSVMERICEERKKDGLPALAIQWGAIGDVGLVADKQEDNIQIEIGGTLQQRIVSCLQSMDKFLKQDAPIVSSIVVAEKKMAGTGQRDVVSTIAQIIGIGDLKMVSHQLALSELGMDSIMAVEIKQVLEREFEIFLTAQEIRGLTLAKLFELSTEEGNATPSDTVAKKEQNASPALQVLIRNFGDEKESTNPYVFVSWKATSETQPAIAEFASNNALFVLPGLESAASVLVPLCNKLNINSYILQLGADPNEVELNQIIEKLYKMIKPRLRPGAPFYFLGYSFGSIPLLALTTRLESEGHRGIFIALDGSLDYVYTLLTTKISSTIADFDLQNAVLMFCVTNMLLVNKSQALEIYKRLNETESIHERAKIVHSVAASSVYSEQYIANVAVSIANRLKISLKLKETNSLKKIKSPIVLIRPKELPLIGTSNLDDSYGLSELTEEPISVHYLDSDHINIVDHEQSSQIINEVLMRFANNGRNTSAVNIKFDNKLWIGS